MNTEKLYGLPAESFSLADLRQMVKPGLAFSVVFSSGAGYLVGMSPFNLLHFVLLLLGGYALVAASNIFNQVIEKDRDAKMQRTQNRPLPAGRMSTGTAMYLGVMFVAIGATMLWFINLKTFVLGLLSLVLYVMVYTPLKARTPLAVFVGAIPGAIPSMLGWVAATNSFGLEAGTLFAIQFIWQFPHFWAIGWMLHDDYQKAGYHLLPSMGGRDRASAFQIVLYTLWMMPVAILPGLGLGGSLHLSVLSAVLITLLGLPMLWEALKLYRNNEVKTARTLMFRSVLYLPLVQLIYVIDKFVA